MKVKTFKKSGYKVCISYNQGLETFCASIRMAYKGATTYKKYCRNLNKLMDMVEYYIQNGKFPSNKKQYRGLEYSYKKSDNIYITNSIQANKVLTAKDEQSLQEKIDRGIVDGTLIIGRPSSTEWIEGQMHRSKIYNNWRAMKSRCYNPNMTEYEYYGGRGIKVCDEWLSSFKSYWTWAIANRYEEGMSLDRIDHTKNYSPDNCRFVTRSENSIDACNRRIERTGRKSDTIEDTQLNMRDFL